MPSQEYLVPPKPAPTLNIPTSSSTVTVRVIDTTSKIVGNMNALLEPHIEDHSTADFPAYSFLVSNKTQHILFDLGVPKNWQTVLPPGMVKMVNKGFKVTVEANTADILDLHAAETGIASRDIRAVIWSHHHFDHIGDMATFPSTTELVVGPGFKKHYTPGYPADPRGVLRESYWEGRSFREIDIAMEGAGLMIGRCAAMDFFGDGSFYVLDTPGHTAGHVCGLARVSSEPDSFVFMGGDACHHGGEFRPTEYLPLPSTIFPSPIAKYRNGGCPGAFLQHIHPKNSATEPFYGLKEGFAHDMVEARESIRKVEEFDAADNVFVVIAHDHTLLDQLDFFPKTINEWMKKNMAAKSRWLFLRDFSTAIEKASRVKL